MIWTTCVISRTAQLGHAKAVVESHYLWHNVREGQTIKRFKQLNQILRRMNVQGRTIFYINTERYMYTQTGSLNDVVINQLCYTYMVAGGNTLIAGYSTYMNKNTLEGNNDAFFLLSTSRGWIPYFSPISLLSCKITLR